MPEISLSCYDFVEGTEGPPLSSMYFMESSMCTYIKMGSLRTPDITFKNWFLEDVVQFWNFFL